jgi:integrase
MPKLTKRYIDALESRDSDYFAWDDDLPGFGLRVFASGKRSYLVQYRAAGRTRRFTIGLHGIWAPEQARREARSLLGRVAKGENPAEERQIDREAITVKELCERYLVDADNGLIVGKKRRPKKPSTLATDRGRIKRHIVPLLGSRRVKDVTTVDVHRFLKDVSSGKTKADEKTRRRGRAIVRGGLGTASRTTGLLGGIFSYAVSHGIIATNPVHGVRRPADNVRDRRLSAEDYRALGEVLQVACKFEEGVNVVAMIRLLALTGCRRGEIINLRWDEVDEAKGCFRLRDTKEGPSIRPVGKAAFAVLAGLRPDRPTGYVFRSGAEGKPFLGFPKAWASIFKNASLAEITPHVLRHSFASIANDLGFTEATIAALLGHSRGTVTSRYVHHLDAVLVNAADIVASHVSDFIKSNRSPDGQNALERRDHEDSLADITTNKSYAVAAAE